MQCLHLQMYQKWNATNPKTKTQDPIVIQFIEFNLPNEHDENLNLILSITKNQKLNQFLYRSATVNAIIIDHRRQNKELSVMSRDEFTFFFSSVQTMYMIRVEEAKASIIVNPSKFRMRKGEMGKICRFSPLDQVQVHFMYGQSRKNSRIFLFFQGFILYSIQ